MRLKRILLALLLVSQAAFGQTIFNTPTQFTTGASLTIQSGVPLLGTWAFSGATVDMTGVTAINFPAGTLTLTGNVTGSGSGTVSTVVATIPDLVSAPGSILYTKVAPVTAPSAGFIKAYADSTDSRFHDRNDAGTVGTTVVAQTAPAHQFFNAVAANGVLTSAQPTPGDLSGSIPLTSLATQAANTVVGNATGGTAVPTAVAPATARTNSLLNIDEKTTVGDASYVILATDRTVVTTVSFTAARTFTLAAANSVNAGQEVEIQDLAGAVNGSNNLTIQRAGADLICPPAGGITSFSISATQVGFGLTLKSDGVSKWFVKAFNPGGANANHRPVTGDGRVYQTEGYSLPGSIGAASYAVNAVTTTGLQAYPTGLNSASVSTASGYTADTYIAGSAPQAVVAGDFKVAGQYHCIFDMVKTAAGVATPIVTVRMGTAATVADAALLTFTFAVGTAAADSATVEVWVNIRTVGATGIAEGVCEIRHALAATGITTTGAAGIAYLAANNASFNFTTPTRIGVSFNGGTSFAGTNVIAQAQLFQP